jgi:hypothetical protein
VHEELEPAHTNPARRPVFVHLDRIEIIAQESTHILKDAILRLQLRKSTQERRFRIKLLLIPFAFWNVSNWE